MAPTPRSSDRAARFRAIIKRRRESCHICGKQIDYDLPRTEPLSFVIDHVFPLAKGGEDALSNVKAAHRHTRVQQQETGKDRRTNRAPKRIAQLVRIRVAMEDRCHPHPNTQGESA